jgi:hypothetical protein
MFRVRANFRKSPSHQIKRSRKRGYSDVRLSERNFEILADDPDDAKVRVRELLKREGYSERSLEHIIWSVSRLDRLRKK